MEIVDLPSFEERVRGIAALDHTVTQAAFRLLVERGQLTRDEMADSLDVARSVAAFHLDKLVDTGLAVVHFARLSGRTGPGAGRPAKVYRRSDLEIEVSLPERHYDLAGGLLAEAIERASTAGVPIDRALHTAATETGRRLGEAARIKAGGRASKAKRRDVLMRLLERNGYEPHLVDGEIVLSSCPFHALAEQHRTLVCGMNLDLLSGVIEGVGDEALMSARLEPQPGYCCVRMKAS
jgi:predicted ArsR family transcriptional regulator